MDKLIPPETPVSPEKPAAPVEAPAEQAPEREAIPETAAEQPPEQAPTESGEVPSGAPAPQATVPTVPAEEVTRDPVLMEVERELEDGLWEAYSVMPPDLRQRFKVEGERVAQVIREGLAAGNLTGKRVIEIITNWLKMIPKINKWFLRQEAKTKADTILEMQKKNQNE